VRNHASSRLGSSGLLPTERSFDLKYIALLR
jgi:hypothetical protein